MRPGEHEYLLRVRCLNEMCNAEATAIIASEVRNRSDILYREGWTRLHSRGWLCPTCSEAIVSYNHEALAQLVKAARELTRWPTLHQGPASGGWYCTKCKAQVADDVGINWLGDENNHDELCPWRLAKEALANLDNPGYSTKGD